MPRLLYIAGNIVNNYNVSNFIYKTSIRDFYSPGFKLSNPGGGSYGSNTLTTTFSESTIYFYSTNAENQLNSTGELYEYVAIIDDSPGVFLITDYFKENQTTIWKFDIVSKNKLVNSDSIDVTISMSRIGPTTTWSTGRYISYIITNGEGSGTTSASLSKPTLSDPDPTFNITITNIIKKAVYITITEVAIQ